MPAASVKVLSRLGAADRAATRPDDGHATQRRRVRRRDGRGDRARHWVHGADDPRRPLKLDRAPARRGCNDPLAERLGGRTGRDQSEGAASTDPDVRSCERVVPTTLPDAAGRRAAENPASCELPAEPDSQRVVSACKSVSAVWERRQPFGASQAGWGQRAAGSGHERHGRVRFRTRPATRFRNAPCAIASYR
jgi:hypothetical protein